MNHVVACSGFQVENISVCLSFLVAESRNHGLEDGPVVDLYPESLATQRGRAVTVVVGQEGSKSSKLGHI